MIRGETRKLRHKETGTAAFTFSALPVWSVLLPDGTAQDSPADFIVTDSPGHSTSATEHTQSANIAFPQGGAYQLTRSMDKSDEGPIVRIETYFAAWTDVYALIRQRLNRNATQLPDATMDPELAYITQEILANYSEVYNDLGGADRAFFDRGLALTVAGRLRPTLTAVSTGEVKRKKLDGQEIEYAVESSTQSKPLVEQWAKEASEAFGRVSFIRAARRSRASAYSSIRVTGPSRAAREAGCRTGMIDDILRLIYPDWCQPCED